MQTVPMKTMTNEERQVNDLTSSNLPSEPDRPHSPSSSSISSYGNQTVSCLTFRRRRVSSSNHSRNHNCHAHRSRQRSNSFTALLAPLFSSRSKKNRKAIAASTTSRNSAPPASSQHHQSDVNQGAAINSSGPSPSQGSSNSKNVTRKRSSPIYQHSLHYSTNSSLRGSKVDVTSTSSISPSTGRSVKLFATDSKRRRRASAILHKSSAMRRSWQVLNNPYVSNEHKKYLTQLTTTMSLSSHYPRRVPSPSTVTSSATTTNGNLIVSPSPVPSHIQHQHAALAKKAAAVAARLNQNEYQIAKSDSSYATEITHKTTIGPGGGLTSTSTTVTASSQSPVNGSVTLPEGPVNGSVKHIQPQEPLDRTPSQGQVNNNRNNKNGKNESNDMIKSEASFLDNKSKRKGLVLHHLEEYSSLGEGHTSGESTLESFAQYKSSTCRPTVESQVLSPSPSPYSRQQFDNANSGKMEKVIEEEEAQVEDLPLQQNLLDDPTFDDGFQGKCTKEQKSVTNSLETTSELIDHHHHHHYNNNNHHQRQAKGHEGHSAPTINHTTASSSNAKNTSSSSNTSTTTTTNIEIVKVKEQLTSNFLLMPSETFTRDCVGENVSDATGKEQKENSSEDASTDESSTSLADESPDSPTLTNWCRSLQDRVKNYQDSDGPDYNNIKDCEIARDDAPQQLLFNSNSRGQSPSDINHHQQQQQQQQRRSLFNRTNLENKRRKNKLLMLDAFLPVFPEESSSYSSTDSCDSYTTCNNNNNININNNANNNNKNTNVIDTAPGATGAGVQLHKTKFNPDGSYTTEIPVIHQSSSDASVPSDSILL